MAERENHKKTKGMFGKFALSVTKKYIYPASRRQLMLLGLVAALAVLVLYVVDSFFLQSSLTTSGPLSSYHAKFEKDCSACHEKFKSVTNANCSVCHEKAGEKLGVYTLAAHQVYRSGELQRLQQSHEEQACYLCHQEHEGREAQITNVTDAQCLSCHKYGSFNEKHPQFEFAAKALPDDSTLKFTHIRHVQEVVKREKLVDVERACLYCHNPQPEGKRFEPIAFATHCQSCHLNANVETPAMRLQNAEEPNALGVMTLETMRNSASPRVHFAAYVSASEFQIKPGNRIVKTRVHHEDPWIMENLRRLRAQYYPTTDFEELLKTSGTLAASNKMALHRQMYEEALQTLESYAAGLRARPEPEVQLELVRVDSLIKATRNKLQHEGAARAFAVPQPQGKVAPQQEVDDFVNNLTKPCQECHMVERASIRRVQQDQVVLARAEFNHRAHILQRRCLDCHTEIPILTAQSDSAAKGSAMILAKSKDRAAIQNLPRVENCQACHNTAETSNRCVTCHFFHPNKTQRTSMLLYLD